LFADDEQWRVPSDYESFVEEDDGAAKGAK
jgi:hypothetical protein